jgi:hypothetical protein
LPCGKIELTFLAIAHNHALFGEDLVKLAEQTSDVISCTDSLKGGTTENCDYMGNRAEKWLAYSTVTSNVLGEFVSDVDKSLPDFATAEEFPAALWGWTATFTLFLYPIPSAQRGYRELPSTEVATMRMGATTGAEAFPFHHAFSLERVCGFGRATSPVFSKSNRKFRLHRQLIGKNLNSV